ncbi:MAG: ABC transporter permease [Verrucomicrobiia bacterium]|jgi:oligopeptide transport system permease protein
MLRFIAIRFAQAVPVLLIISIVTFAMIKAVPGGPFDKEKKVPEEVERALNEYYHLDETTATQYWIWLKNVTTRGDFGPSMKYSNRSVNEIIAASFPISLQLGVMGICIALTLGLGAGIVASIRPNSAWDYIPMSFAMIGICVPRFVIGPLFMLMFAINWEWYNASGWFFWSDRVLPALTLGIFYAAYVARLTRGGMLEVLGQDYIRTARAKGASEMRVILRHALRGGIRPVVSYFGPAMANLLAGSFIVEKIFSIPGLGTFFITSISNRDYPMIMGTVLFYSVLIISLNLLADIVLVWLNPKLRFNES